MCIVVVYLYVLCIDIIEGACEKITEKNQKLFYWIKKSNKLIFYQWVTYIVEITKQIPICIDNLRIFPTKRSYEGEKAEKQREFSIIYIL